MLWYTLLQYATGVALSSCLHPTPSDLQPFAFHHKHMAPFIWISHAVWQQQEQALGSHLHYGQNAVLPVSPNAICLSVCLRRLCITPPLHLYLLPWQQSSRDTQLSCNPLPQPSSQQIAVEELLAPICLSSVDRELPLGSAVTSQAAWETAWWRLCSVLLSLALIPATVRLNTKSS